jgi:hypothetical protein
VEPWQVEQAQEALRVLYQECLPRPWAQPWALQTHPPAIARGFLPRESFRDEFSARAVDAAHREKLSQLRTELRVRHYSLRTEQACEHWMRRSVTFHELKSPRELGPAAVKEYLEYLALERKVSASTQNHALNARRSYMSKSLGNPLARSGSLPVPNGPSAFPWS